MKFGWVFPKGNLIGVSDRGTTLDPLDANWRESLVMRFWRLSVQGECVVGKCSRWWDGEQRLISRKERVEDGKGESVWKGGKIRRPKREGEWEQVRVEWGKNLG